MLALFSVLTMLTVAANLQAACMRGCGNYEDLGVVNYYTEQFCTTARRLIGRGQAWRRTYNAIYLITRDSNGIYPLT